MVNTNEPFFPETYLLPRSFVFETHGLVRSLLEESPSFAFVELEIVLNELVKFIVLRIFVEVRGENVIFCPFLKLAFGGQVHSTISLPILV